MNDEASAHETHPRPAHPRTVRDDVTLPIDPDLAPGDPSAPSVDHHALHQRRQRRSPRELLAIGVGGFVGTAARYGLERAWPTPHGGFPAATFAINTSGALVLGILLTTILESRSPWRYLRVLTCVGFLGAWTTMSTLATEADLLVHGGDAGVAVAYVAASLAAGLAAVAVGIAVGRRRWAPS